LFIMQYQAVAAKGRTIKNKYIEVEIAIVFLIFSCIYIYIDR
jgi:hypothetical protein